MRLSRQTQQVIRETVREIFGAEANVFEVMTLTSGLPADRFLQTLEIVVREGKHLSIVGTESIELPQEDLLLTQGQNGSHFYSSMTPHVARLSSRHTTDATND